MNTPKLSVIIPVYNAEKYLTHCIDSILGQSFSDLELLLIDDGSTDGSADICDSYVQKDCRVKAFHKKNEGVVSARRTGVAAVSNTADYLFFVDSDDYVPVRGIEQAYDEMRSKDLDILVTAEDLININGKTVRKSRYARTGYLTKKQFAVELLIGTELLMSPHGKMYKKSLVLETKAMDTDPSFTLNEDLLMNLKIGSQSERIFISNDIVSYHYRLRKDGLGHQCKALPYWLNFFDVSKDILIKGYDMPNNDELKVAFDCFQLGKVYRNTWNEDTEQYKQDLIVRLKSVKELRHDSRKQLCIIRHIKFTFFIRVFFKIRKMLVSQR